MKFPCCLSLFCFISRSSSFSVFYVSVDTEISSKKHSAVLLFFLLNVLGAIRFFPQTRGFVIAKFHSGLHLGRTYIHTYGLTDGHVTTSARESSPKRVHTGILAIVIMGSRILITLRHFLAFLSVSARF